MSRASVDDLTDPYLENQVYIVTPYDKTDRRNSYSDKESKDLFQKAFDKEEDLVLIDDVIYKKDSLFVPLSRRLELVEGIHSAP